MKAKTIKAILRKKLDAFTATITDENIRKLIQRDTIITGGSIASMLLDEKVNDYDLYFSTQETALAVANYYAALFVSAETGNAVSAGEKDGRVFLHGPGLGPVQGLRMDAADAEDQGAQEAVEDANNDGTYRLLFASPNAITLSDGIQIVIRFTGPAAEIHKNYDFVHCTNYWTSVDDNLVLHPAALEALLTKELRYVGSLYPLCSIIRTRKFLKRGWQINAGQYLKMALQLNELNLFDIPTLKEQLVGVDSAHFMALIEKVKEGNPEKINSSYICEIVDRMF